MKEVLACVKLCLFLMLCCSMILSCFLNAPTWVQKQIKKMIGGVVGIHIHLDTHTKALLDSSDSKKTLFLSNHISYIDIFVYSVCTNTRFLAKHEMQFWPLFGALAKASRTIFVNRDSLGGRVFALRKLKKELNRHSYLVFPEGTTTMNDTPKAENWKSGQLWSAKGNQNQIIMLGLSYVDQADIAWIDEMTLLPHLWMVFKRNRLDAFVTARVFEFDASCIRENGLSVLSYVKKLSLNSQLMAGQFNPHPNKNEQDFFSNYKEIQQ